MKKWQCVVCGLVYDESEGWPDDGKADFEMIGIN